MKSTAEILAERLILARKKKGLSQESASEIADINRSMIAKYETQTSQPAVDTLVKLALAYDVTSDYLLGLSDTMGSKQPTLTDMAAHNSNGANELIREQVTSIMNTVLDDFKRGLDRMNQDKGT